MKHELPELPYAYDALEPHFDKMTMEIHHSRHHKAYIDKYVAALETAYPQLLERPVDALLRNIEQVPEDIKTAVINNGGGYYNHNLFWDMLTPDSPLKPKGALLEAIEKTFGSFDAFKETFNQVAATRFGSGWAWLLLGKDKSLKVVSSANQDVPFDEGEPLLALDVWEHAYYLKYQNKRPDYIKAFWNVVNWDKVEALYEEAK